MPKRTAGCVAGGWAPWWHVTFDARLLGWDRGLFGHQHWRWWTHRLPSWDKKNSQKKGHLDSARNHKLIKFYKGRGFWYGSLRCLFKRKGIKLKPQFFNGNKSFWFWIWWGDLHPCLFFTTGHCTPSILSTPSISSSKSSGAARNKAFISSASSGRSKDGRMLKRARQFDSGLGC